MSNSRIRSASRVRFRRLATEQLELRSLLTGSPWHNTVEAFDVNDDSEVTITDFHNVAFELSEDFHNSVAVNGSPGQYGFTDVNDDFWVDYRDYQLIAEELEIGVPFSVVTLQSHAINEDAGSASIRVTREGGLLDQPIEFLVDLQFNGSADANDISLDLQGNLQFAAQQTEAFIPVIINNNGDEATEYFNIVLSPESLADETILVPGVFQINGLGGGNPSTTLAFQVSEFNEFDVSEKLQIQRTGDLNAAFTANWSVEDGTATSDDGDFTTTSGEINFDPGQECIWIDLPVADDHEAEGSETFNIYFFEDEHEFGAAEITIAPSDWIWFELDETANLPALNLHRSPDATWLDGPEGPSIDITTADGTAVEGEDFTLASNSVQFSAGSDRVSVPLSSLADANRVGGEDFGILAQVSNNNTGEGNHPLEANGLFQIAGPAGAVAQILGATAPGNAEDVHSSLTFVFPQPIEEHPWSETSVGRYGSAGHSVDIKSGIFKTLIGLEFKVNGDTEPVYLYGFNIKITVTDTIELNLFNIDEANLAGTLDADGQLITRDFAYGHEQQHAFSFRLALENEVRLVVDESKVFTSAELASAYLRDALARIKTVESEVRLKEQTHSNPASPRDGVGHPPHGTMPPDPID